MTHLHLGDRALMHNPHGLPLPLATQQQDVSEPQTPGSLFGDRSTESLRIEDVGCPARCRDAETDTRGRVPR